MLFVVGIDQRIVDSQRERNVGRGRTSQLDPDFFVHLARDGTVVPDQEQVFGQAGRGQTDDQVAAGGVHILDRLAHILVRHRRIGVLILHVVGTETGTETLRGVEARHAQQRVDPLAVAAFMRHAAGFPEGLEVLGEDILLGLPAFLIGFVEAILQIGVAVRIISLHDAVVEAVGHIGMHGIGHAVDHKQASRPRLGADVFAHGQDQLPEQLVVMSHERPRSAVAGFVVDVDAVVAVLVHRVLAVGFGVGLDGLVGIFAAADLGEERLGHLVREDREGHLRALDLLHELLVGDLLGGQRMPLAPDGDDIHRVGSTLQAGLVGCADGRPRTVPAESDLVLGLFVFAQGLVVGIIAQDGRLLVGMLRNFTLGIRPIRTSDEKGTHDRKGRDVFQEIFHLSCCF